MKMFYQDPELEVVLFAAEDVIATSGTGTGGGMIDGGVGDGDSSNFEDLFPDLVG